MNYLFELFKVIAMGALAIGGMSLALTIAYCLVLFIHEELTTKREGHGGG